MVIIIDETNTNVFLQAKEVSQSKNKLAECRGRSQPLLIPTTFSYIAFRKGGVT